MLGKTTSPVLHLWS